MTRRIYRTAQGKTVDIGALQLRNENVRAVGNQKVNARGDMIDSNNRPIVTRNQQVARQYRRQITNTSDGPVPSSAADVQVPLPPEDFDDDFQRPVQDPPAVQRKVPSGTTAPEAPGQGLAAAIARARQVRQEPLKTPREVAQQTPGVRKL
jgi:hypothetical protein